jgi:hypothetical protein
MSQGILQGLQIGSQLGENMFGPRQRRQLLQLQQEAEFERQKQLAQFNSDLAENKENRLYDRNAKILEQMMGNSTQQPAKQGLAEGALMDLGVRGAPAAQGEYLTPIPKEGGGFSFAPSGEKFNNPAANRSSYIAPQSLGLLGKQQLTERAGLAQDAITNNSDLMSPASVDKSNKVIQANSLSQGLNVMGNSPQGEPQAPDRQAHKREYIKAYGPAFLNQKGGVAALLKAENDDWYKSQQDSYNQKKQPLELEKLTNDIEFNKRHREYTLKRDKLLTELEKEINPLKIKQIESQIKNLDIRNQYQALMFQNTLDNGSAYRENVNAPTFSQSTSTIDPTTGAKITNTTRTKGAPPSGGSKKALPPMPKFKVPKFDLNN